MMAVGKKSGGKHWTKAEVEARRAAAEETQRDTRAYLKAPDWLTEEAKQVWESTRRKLRGIELLDNLDTELLAIYCDAVAKYREASKNMDPESSDSIKAVQAWARIISVYADKLGLSPAGRARLAKKKAEKETDPFADTFGG